MRLPGGLAWRHVLAAAFALALVLLPLYILSYDPVAKLERLRTPFCRGSFDVEAKNQEGGASLLVPDSGIHVRATIRGEPVPAKLTLFLRDAGKDWRYHWDIDTSLGEPIFYLPYVTPGMMAQVRASDPSGKVCPGDSPILVAPMG